MWLHCIGGVSGFVIRRYIGYLILLIPTPLALALFLQLHPSFFVYLKKCFLFLLLFLCNIANVAQRTFEMVQKSRSRGLGYNYNYIDERRLLGLPLRGTDTGADTIFFKRGG